MQNQLTDEQKSALALIQASKKIPVVHVETPEQFDRVMGDE